MPRHGTGPFDVKVVPLDPAVKTDDNSLGRMSLDKQYHGDLDATAKGEMLTGGSIAKAPADTSPWNASRAPSTVALVPSCFSIPAP